MHASTCALRSVCQLEHSIDVPISNYIIVDSTCMTHGLRRFLFNIYCAKCSCNRNRLKKSHTKTLLHYVSRGRYQSGFLLEFYKDIRNKPDRYLLFYNISLFLVLADIQVTIVVFSIRKCDNVSRYRGKRLLSFHALGALSFGLFCKRRYRFVGVV